MAKHPWLELENWAVVGATTNPHRYGNLIMKRLMENGYNTIPVTPAYDEVEGVEAFPSILDLEFAPDVVNFVVNPKIGKDVLVDCIEKGVKRIWLQPGTHSHELVEKAEEAGIEVIEGCILVVLAHR